jgi:Glycosyl hydrolase family 62
MIQNTSGLVVSVMAPHVSYHSCGVGTRALVLFCLIVSSGCAGGTKTTWVTTGVFHWEGGPSVLAIDPSKLPPASSSNAWGSVRDPSMVYYKSRWHLFASILKITGGESGRVRIGYMSFTDWSQAQAQDWHLIELYNPGDYIDYHGAPQIFFFTPQNRWYLIYQLVDKARGITYGPCYSTSNDISDPKSWTLPTRLWPDQAGVQPGLDHWVICDDLKCHHFYSTLDGNIWRADTLIADFPAKWTTPVVAVTGNIFEATHTYKIAGINKYITVADTHGNATVGERIQTAYLADRLDGPWTPLADTNAKSFASLTNTTFPAGKWTNTIDHGELIRAGYDQKLEIDPNDLRWVYQGKTDVPYAYDFQLGMLVFK